MGDWKLIPSFSIKTTSMKLVTGTSKLNVIVGASVFRSPCVPEVARVPRFGSRSDRCRRLGEHQAVPTERPGGW
jgi:hypothetical protein